MFACSPRLLFCSPVGHVQRYTTSATPSGSYVNNQHIDRGVVVVTSSLPQAATEVAPVAKAFRQSAHNAQYKYKQQKERLKNCCFEDNGAIISRRKQSSRLITRTIYIRPRRLSLS